MRIISLNANGIRAAARKGFFDWMVLQEPDVVCIQETKAQIHQLDDPIFSPEGYYCYYCDAEKKGYSGVAIYSRQKPDRVISGLGFSVADIEGRYIQIDLGKLSVVSLYLPSGTSGDVRQDIKYNFLEQYGEILQDLIAKKRRYIICGDWNIAHKAIDLKNWRPNQKHSGFLPKERAWMDTLFDEWGFVDSFRLLNKEPDQYTWWSNRGQSWAKNVGWRIDYQIITPNLAEHVRAVDIYKEERFSDHAPLIVDYESIG